MMISLVILAALVLLALHIGSVLLCLGRLAPSEPQMPGIGQPAITLLRPVCGRDNFDAATLASSFGLDWPDYEIIFCVPSGDDPAVPLLRELIARHPGQRAQLLCGQIHITGNPKLDNLWKGWRIARADWICMADSNLLLPRDYLRRVAEAWGPETGLVSCPPAGSLPEGLAGHLECSFLNGNQARIQMAAASLGLGFAQGKTMFWNRAMLESAGGLRALGRDLAEDVAATKLTRNEGLRVALPHQPFVQPIGRRDLRQVWNRQLRWSRVRRAGFPLMFLCEIANGIALPLLMLSAAITAAGASPLWSGLFALIWWGAEVALMARSGWPCTWRDILVLPLRDALLPAIWIATFARRGIEWRGHTMEAPVVTPSQDSLPAGARA